MSWSATQYSKFEAERNRPIHDLLAHIPTAKVMNAADIGCGPGNSTELLQRHFPEASVTGMDSSPDMIEAARKRMPGIGFGLGDIATWRSARPLDVILANAALQWVPDHATLLPNLVAQLAPGGSLAVQTPDNLLEPAHVRMREIAGDGPWAGKMAGAARSMDSRHSPDWYFRCLKGAGATVDLWRTTYMHQLSGGPSAVVEWFKGSALRPFLKPLDQGEQEAFLARYEAAMAEAYPPQPDGTVLLPFPRLFYIATR